MTEERPDSSAHTSLADPAAAPGHIERLDRHHLYELVRHQIARLIERGEYPKGTRLPGEVDLAARFGVSRPIIRRALSMLRDANYLATRKGSGTVVVKDGWIGQPAFAVLSNETDLKQFYEYRLPLEGAIASMAAQRRGEEDLSKLRLCLTRSEIALQAGQSRLVSDLNFSFHRAVAAATGNKFFAATFEALPNLTGETAASRAFGSVRENERRQWRLIAEHRRVLEAIERRSMGEAEAAMLDHVSRSMGEVLKVSGGW